MKGIIPIGGRGTRMRPATFTVNKHFIPVGNKLLIEYPIEALVSAGITQIAITYNPGQLSYAQKILGDGSRWGARFNYILQDEPRGLAHIVQICEKWVGQSRFVFHLGDNIFTQGVKDLVEHFKREKPDGLIAMVHHSENSRMGVPYFNKKHRLIKYVEKPAHPPHDYAVPGIYFGSKNFFRAFRGRDAVRPSKRKELEITSPFQWLIDHGYRVDVHEYKGVWLDPGKFGDWLETNQYLLSHLPEETVSKKHLPSNKLEGKIVIGKKGIISHSTLRGPVAIGNNVTLRNSFIGPYTSIYHNCTIQNCHIQNTVLMSDVTLKDIEKPIDSSIIGPHCDIEGTESRHIELFVGEMGRILL